ncbi:ATP phosphoribosyltransferase, partial [Brachyspira hampsonii]|nr:ATP phosphoribosyltransferase [Brachyspira hampsonii]
MINIALPKGRLVNKVYTLFEKIGYENKEILEDNRKLVFENKDKNVRYLIVKPSDVGIYVEKGVADIGIVGKDILLENNHDVYELLDLKFGKCKVCMASVNGYKEDIERRLRVATKYVNISKNYFNSINRDVEIIKLNGSIELAPILNLSDVIVDIVETGSTL